MENRDGQAYQLPGRFDNKGDIHNEEDDLVLGSALVAELDAIAAESQRIARWTAKATL